MKTQFGFFNSIFFFTNYEEDNIFYFMLSLANLINTYIEYSYQ